MQDRKKKKERKENSQSGQDALKMLNLPKTSIGVARWKHFLIEILPENGLLLVMGVNEAATCNNKKSQQRKHFAIKKKG